MTEYFMPISELSKKLDVPAHTLRYWEKEFPAIITPTTGAGGRRFYRPTVVEAIFALKKYLYADGRTIDGVKKMILNGEFSACGGQADAPIDAPVDAPAPIDGASIQTAIDLLTEAKGILG
ncbi:MAG: MerR family transcriptional regulator [Rickettsiales bacterium]|jgi:DNA-binding transcriptional MerR regulator|nr:MerR family transcriptional regulator [Rickettsiales bacterium]